MAEFNIDDPVIVSGFVAIGNDLNYTQMKNYPKETNIQNKVGHIIKVDKGISGQFYYFVRFIDGSYGFEIVNGIGRQSIKRLPPLQNAMQQNTEGPGSRTGDIVFELNRQIVEAQRQKEIEQRQVASKSSDSLVSIFSSLAQESFCSELFRQHFSKRHLQLVAEQQAAEQRAAEQQAAEQRAAEQRAAEQRVVATAEQRLAEQRVVATAEQRLAEQRVAERNYQVFNRGSRFENIHTRKKGTVENLRNDSRERTERNKDSLHYRYSVKYDDGSFDTDVNQNNMKQL